MKNIKVSIDDEDMTQILIDSLFKYFENFKDVFIYGKESTITLNEVQMIIRSKELSKIKYLKIDDNGDRLNVS